jgi:hypothetical protein
MIVSAAAVDPAPMDTASQNHALLVHFFPAVTAWLTKKKNATMAQPIAIPTLAQRCAKSLIAVITSYAQAKKFVTTVC